MYIYVTCARSVLILDMQLTNYQLGIQDSIGYERLCNMLTPNTIYHMHSTYVPTYVSCFVVATNDIIIILCGLLLRKVQPLVVPPT